MKTREIRFPARKVSLYMKARRLGWVTVWSGEGIITMKKERK